MILRHLEYLVALAREKHFGRAAEACHVSQPTLSAAIRLLEEDLGAPIVERGHRYVGLTPQGRVALEHAHRILAEAENLRSGLEEIDKGLTGRLRIGAIPTALPIVSQITRPFYAQFPGVTIAIYSMTSHEIERGIEDFELDAGLTYLDAEPIERVRAKPVCVEEYVFLTPAAGGFAAREHLLERGGRDATLPVDARHAEPAHYRRRVPLRRRKAGPRGGNEFNIQPRLARERGTMVGDRAAPIVALLRPAARHPCDRSRRADGPPHDRTRHERSRTALSAGPNLFAMEWPVDVAALIEPPDRPSEAIGGIAR